MTRVFDEQVTVCQVAAKLAAMHHVSSHGPGSHFAKRADTARRHQDAEHQHDGGHTAGSSGQVGLGAWGSPAEYTAKIGLK